MKRVSSILFALSIFGGVAYAQPYKQIDAELTFDRSVLEQEGGAELVLADLEAQAKKACRQVSLVSVALTVDEVCAQDILVQAIEYIDDEDLTEQYAGSNYYTETTSERIEVAAR